MQILSDKFDSFGLDIGDRSIKAAHVRRCGSDFELKKYGLIDIPEGIIDKGSILKHNQASFYIKKLLNSTVPDKIREPYVNACLPETQTFIKLINISLDKKDDLASRVREELATHIPVEIDKSYIDWHVVKKDEKNGYLNVIAGAVPKQTADEYNNLLSKTSLIPVSLRIEAESISNALLPQEISHYSGPAAIIDIGATRSGFILIDKGYLQFSVSLDTAGNDITNKIKQSAGFTPEEAEKAKRTCGLEESRCEPQVTNILKNEMQNLALSIKQNIEFYYEHFIEPNQIKTVILCGGGAYQPGLEKELETNLPGVEVLLGRPIISFVSRKNTFYKKMRGKDIKSIYKCLEKYKDFHIPKSFTQKHELSYATAIGLALTNVI